MYLRAHACVCVCVCVLLSDDWAHIEAVGVGVDVCVGVWSCQVTIIF